MPDPALDTIFKAYDIRGIYPDEIDESIARRIGNAFVAFTGAARVLVGRDARPSSEPLVAAFIEGATWRAPTSSTSGSRPPTSATSRPGSLDAPGGDVHRQPQPRAVQRHQAVPGRRRARSGRRPAWPRSRRWSPAGSSSAPRTPGGSSAATCCRAFVAHVHSFVDLDALAPLRVVADTANGIGGLDRARGVRGPPVRPHASSTASSTARSRTTRPTRSSVENLKDLQRAVLDADADVGLAFDGDADRVFLVDDQGAAGVGFDHHRDRSRRRSSTGTRARRSCTT